MRISLPLSFIVMLIACPALYATVWQVGPGRTYKLPSTVATLVRDSDTVDIDAGLYPSDVARWQANNLLLRGVGGYAHLISNGASYGNKAIWVIAGTNTTVEWVEFSECSSTDQNGAGIRQEGANLTVRHCYFHDNEDGILAGRLNPSTMTIEFTEFNHNGFGDGYSHNLYIGNIDTLIFRFNYSHHCNVGHELKSRAYVNHILYNRISNEATGNASREIDLPNGGTAVIIGNIIEQGPNAENSGIIGYGLEGLSNPVPHELYLVNNTVVNDRSAGTFVQVGSGTALYTAYNNIFAGPGTRISGLPAQIDTASNWNSQSAGSAGFLNAGAYDYHLTAGSSAIDGGRDPGVAGNGLLLMPKYEYLHPADSVSRAAFGTIDIGAFEHSESAEVMAADDPDHFDIHVRNGVLYINSKVDCAQVSVYDLLGRLVLVADCADGGNRVDLSGVPGRIYIVRASAGKNVRAGTIVIP
jgi:hypothetical protein